MLKKVRESAVDGVLLGVGIAVLLSAFVLVMGALSGTMWIDRYGVSRWTVVLGYLFAGPAAGIVGGVLAPFATRLVARLALAALVGTVVYGTLGILMLGITWPTFWMAVLVGSIVGIGVELLGFRRDERARPE